MISDPAGLARPAAAQHARAPPARCRICTGGRAPVCTHTCAHARILRGRASRDPRPASTYRSGPSSRTSRRMRNLSPAGQLPSARVTKATRVPPPWIGCRASRERGGTEAARVAAAEEGRKSAGRGKGKQVRVRAGYGGLPAGEGDTRWTPQRLLQLGPHPRCRKARGGGRIARTRACACVCVW